MACKIIERESAESLSIELWKEALSKLQECALTDNVLFIARDVGSLAGLRRKHGDSSRGGFYGIAPDKAHVYFDLGMTFRFAYLILPSDAIVAGITPLVTESLTIARRKQKGTLL